MKTTQRRTIWCFCSVVVVVLVLLAGRVSAGKYRHDSSNHIVKNYNRNDAKTASLTITTTTTTTTRESAGQEWTAGIMGVGVGNQLLYLDAVTGEQVLPPATGPAGFFFEALTCDPIDRYFYGLMKPYDLATTTIGVPVCQFNLDGLVGCLHTDNSSDNNYTHGGIGFSSDPAFGGPFVVRENMPLDILFSFTFSAWTYLSLTLTGASDIQFYDDANGLKYLGWIDRSALSMSTNDSYI
eukprot:TRINITY_DN1462_c0_g1_i1.p1 TRINITY_DN1462_c0_g1~~TRINITY_DN1462_c0_g1_i1.p1  ORF type:complete len:259 (+),score=46.92 TRINITY_DN1462_c0_g1_i1:63-779(+)